MALQHLRSSTADKRPTPAAMSDGQLALNTNLASPGLFFKDSNGDSVKIGPVHVGTTAPNVTPGAGGQAGNSKGEQWLDTSSSRYVFKIWDGTAWRTEDGEFVNASGDTMTGALVHPLGAVGTPSITFTGDLNTGIWSPAADTVAASTAGSERLRITSAGLVGIGTSAPVNLLDVEGGIGCNYANGLHAVRDQYTTNNVILRHQFVSPNDQLELTPIGNSTTSAIALRTASASTVATRMFIGPTGLVGIGTTSPGALLHAAGIIRAGAADTSDAAIQIGASLSGNRNSYLDLVGDTTYSTYGLRVIRNNSGANATSQLLHRGTGNLDLVAQEAASIAFYTTNQERARIDPSGRLLVGISSDSGGALLQVNGDRIRVGTAKTPATSGATGTTGEIAWDANYIYVCTATNTWKRVAIATW